MRKLVLSILFLMQTVLVFAQQTGSITGKVVDAKSQKSLHNVVVSLQNTTVTQLTNTEGVFLLEGVSAGNHLVQIKSDGYTSQIIPVELAEGQVLDLALILLEEDITSELQLSLITLTENDLGDDNSGSETTSGLLQASRDAFEQVSAFNWGQARFRIRGLDNEYGTVMINGITMNKLYDGRPQWSNWGGLNDATRNQEFTTGSKPSNYTFGGVLGTQHINTRASFHRPGTRVSFAGANTNYNWRTMVTHASGLNKDGWAYTLSASYRMAEEGHFEGTDYDALSLFASVEKKINDNHSINFTSIYAQNSRGKNSPNTEEVNDLMGIRYNSYWGWHDGKKRNSRDKDVEEPVFILSHYWKMDDKNRLNTNIAFQTGHIANSRFDYQSANNPDPTYYKNLPSYYINNGQPELADEAADFFRNNSQINWGSIYQANQATADGNSAYVLYEDRVQDTQVTANVLFDSNLSENISFNAGVIYKNLRSENFQELTDLLGGKYFRDIDLFYVGDASQSDLNNPNRIVGEGDRYGYNYKLYANVYDAFTQFKFNYRKFDFYLAQTFTRTEYEREGLYRNGIYADNSYGRSGSKLFENFGFKGGFTYKLTGNHLFDFNGAYMTKAPNMRNTFSNARLNNNFTPNLDSETIMAADASYILRTPKFKGRLTGYMSQVHNATEISFYYAESIGDGTGDEDAFVSEIMTDINKRNIGLELGMEYQITQTIKLTGAASYGQYIYSNNPTLFINDDEIAANGGNSLIDFGKASLKNYRLAGMPQQAYSLGIEYRDPKYWWIGANANYLDDNYLDVSNVLRTQNFVLDTNGEPYPGVSEESVRNFLKQEKFDSFFLVNLTGGKSWIVNTKTRSTLGFFASVNNVFDVEYKTGGFEQSRKAAFPDMVADTQNGVRSFGPKYFYGYGRTYFVNLYINF